jgi:hypothetical protein
MKNHLNEVNGHPERSEESAVLPGLPILFRIMKHAREANSQKMTS